MALILESGGLLTTVQDLGRRGAQRFAVAEAGAMDRVSHAVANLLVGNAIDAATLEITLTGPRIRFDAPHLIALAGADLDARLDGVRVPPGHAAHATAGSTLGFGARSAGCRAYLAVAGGVDVPQVLGSRSTDLAGGFGGCAGRALRAGDVLHAMTPGSWAERQLRATPAGTATRWLASPAWHPNGVPAVRALAGPQHETLPERLTRRFWEAEFRVSRESNRMGYRLDGPDLSADEAPEIASEPVAFGTVQLPRGGQPIVLMADRQTVGGYPKIACAIDADASLLAQLAPGNALTFRRCTLEEAEAARAQRDRELRVLADALRLM